MKQTNTDSNDWLSQTLNNLHFENLAHIDGSHGSDDQHVQAAKQQILTHISKHYIPKEQVDEMVREARIEEAEFYLLIATDQDNIRPNWVAKITFERRIAQLSTNKKGGE